MLSRSGELGKGRRRGEKWGRGKGKWGPILVLNRSQLAMAEKAVSLWKCPTPQQCRR